MKSTRIRYVSYLAVAAIVATAVSFSYSFLVYERIDETTRELLSLDGFNAALFLPAWAPYGYYIAQVVVLCSLFWLSAFTRYLFLANVVVFNGLGLLLGVSVALPVEILLTTLVQLLYGGILILLFLPTVVADSSDVKRDEEAKLIEQRRRTV